MDDLNSINKHNGLRRVYRSLEVVTSCPYVSVSFSALGAGGVLCMNFGNGSTGIWSVARFNFVSGKLQSAYTDFMNAYVVESADLYFYHTLIIDYPIGRAPGYPLLDKPHPYQRPQAR